MIEEKLQDNVGAFGFTASHKTTTAEFFEKSTDMKLLGLITIFQQDFTETRNIYHSFGKFSGQNRKKWISRTAFDETI